VQTMDSRVRQLLRWEILLDVPLVALPVPICRLVAEPIGDLSKTNAGSS
jgi:hypothetical protein